MGKQKSKVGVDLTGAWMPREKAEDIKQHEFFEARFLLLPKQWQSWYRTEGVPGSSISWTRMCRFTAKLIISIFVWNWTSSPTAYTSLSRFTATIVPSLSYPLLTFPDPPCMKTGRYVVLSDHPPFAMSLCQIRDGQTDLEIFVCHGWIHHLYRHKGNMGTRQINLHDVERSNVEAQFPKIAISPTL
ncbi:hypothetical protein SAY86_008622 [Trapa natans]|uniref:Uncharacterized protein n=1 Tax=Trapa natans TaxID=22666 RepID=A0AAN7KD74_TRANT|nr:hypothetical protein SAY86_008622 [Trapa natans]